MVMLEYISIEDSLYYHCEGWMRNEWDYTIGEKIEHEGKNYIIISIDSVYVSSSDEKLKIGMTVREYEED